MSKPEQTAAAHAGPHDVAAGVQYDARHANAYERKIRALIPGYALLHELSSHLLVSWLGDAATIVVAGSGTGEEISRYAAANTGWHLAGVDPSADMQALARQRLHAEGVLDRVALFTGKLSEVVLPGPYDAATSLLVMHFLPDDGTKLAYLQALAAVLPIGAPLLLADLTGTRGEADFDALFRVWRQQQDATRHNPDHVALDFAHLERNVYPVSAARRAALLAEAGFAIELEYWRALGLSAILATRS